MIRPQSWAFASLESVWIWKTLTGYLSFTHEKEEFIAMFPTCELAVSLAREGRQFGYPIPCQTRHMWVAAPQLPADGCAGYAWIEDGEGVELYRVEDMPLAAYDLFPRLKEAN